MCIGEVSEASLSETEEQGLAFGVQGVGCRVQGAGCRVQGVGYRALVEGVGGPVEGDAVGRVVRVERRLLQERLHLHGGVFHFIRSSSQIYYAMAKFLSD